MSGNKKAWERRIAAGLCQYCGKNSPDSAKGSKVCIECKRQRYERYKDRYYMSPEKQRQYRRKIHKEVLEKYGGKCECCGEIHWEYLSIDHINQDGAKERKHLYGQQGGCPHRFYLKLKKEPKRNDLRVLCMNCNTAFFKYGYSPKCQCKGKT